MALDNPDAQHYLTNAFTVLSVRIIADLNLDGTINAADWALLPSLSHSRNWWLPAAPSAHRKIRLRNEVGVTGHHTLHLSGTSGAFRLWQTATPQPGTAPLLECGGSITNGNGVTFLSGTDSDIYIEALANGTATLTYSFQGTESASDLYVAASLPIAAWSFGLILIITAMELSMAQIAFALPLNEAFRWWTNDDYDVGDCSRRRRDIPGQASPNYADSVVNGGAIC